MLESVVDLLQGQVPRSGIKWLSCSLILHSLSCATKHQCQAEGRVGCCHLHELLQLIQDVVVVLLLQMLAGGDQVRPPALQGWINGFQQVFQSVQLPTFIARLENAFYEDLWRTFLEQEGSKKSEVWDWSWQSGICSELHTLLGQSLSVFSSEKPSPGMLHPLLLWVAVYTHWSSFSPQIYSLIITFVPNAIGPACSPTRKSDTANSISISSL